MRIKPFSEARGIFDRDEFSLKPHIYCFGGGGDTGGGSAGDFDDSYNQSMGYTDSSGKATGTGSDSDPDRTDSGAVDRVSNYDSKVQDAIDRGEDLTTDRAFDIAAAAVGGGRAGQTGAERASISEAEVAAARAGVPSDVFVQSAGGNIVRSKDGTPVTSSRSVEEAAKAAGTSTSSVMEAIKGAAGKDFGEGFGDNFDPKGDIFAPTAVTQAARGPALGPTALSPEQDARLTAMLAAEGVPLPDATTPAQAEGRQAARDAFAAGTGKGLIEDFDVFDVDALGPVDLDEVPGGAIGVGTPAGSPAQQITQQATAPAQIDMSPQQGRVVSETVLDGPQDVAAGLPPVDLDETPAGALSLAGTLDPFAEMEKEVAQGLGSLAAAPESSYTGMGSLNYSPAPTPDPVGASIDRAISDFAGYREGQTRTQTPEGVVVDDFMLTRDLVSQPTEFGSTYSPLEQLRMQEGTRTVPAVNVPDIDVFGAKIPTSIAGRVLSDVLTPASALDRALQDPSTRAIYDAQGRIEGAVDKYGTVYDATPYDFESSDAMKAAYAEQNRRQEAERGGGDGGQAPIIPPAQEVVPEPVQEEYQGRDIVGASGYQPRGPLSYAYTGLPSLAPQRLRPSFQARGSYSPLFPIGQRRS